MRIAVIGGGPAGLYFSSLIKQLNADADITVWERNAPDDTFGFGVVFSDQTLSGIKASDRSVFNDMGGSFAYWDDVDIDLNGTTVTVGGNGFAAMSRKELLNVLQRRALSHGVPVHFQTEAPPVEELMENYDLVIACDGIGSPIREKFADHFGTTTDPRSCKYMWLGTDKVFEAFEFIVRDTPFGVIQIHAYPMDAHKSTFIVEMHEDVWRAGGFDAVDPSTLPPGVSDEESISRVREIFADVLEGHELIANNSKWIEFRVIRNKTLTYKNLVLMGDSAHTSHFSIGSGTKLAMEDALSLAACIGEEPDLASALAAFNIERHPVIKSTQRSAQASLEWFEEIGQYTQQDPIQFAFNLMTRSRRITYDNLLDRDPAFITSIDNWLLESEVKSGRVPAGTTPRPPMFLPFQMRDVVLPNRVVVAPMHTYSATDGLPNEFHEVHLGARALGGAGLILTEFAAISADGRVTPGCTGIWNDAQRDAWRTIVDFVHTTESKIGIQIGHSGPKGATKVMSEGRDQPLESGGWEVMGASPVPFSPANQVPKEMTRTDMDTVLEQFVQATTRAADANFDLLELQASHGSLLASFLSPVSNKRADVYGGAIENRLAFPLEVFDAVRQAWPSGRPISVRISATDWVPEGLTDADAIAIAQAFKDHGADIIDVSTGETTSTEKPAYGRSYQTPYSDRIRNQVGVPTIAVGAISSWDDVNTIIASGRADLCAVGRPHLYDPAWTVHAAAEQGFNMAWPVAYAAGKSRPAAGRNEDPKPRLELVPQEGVVTRPSRWRVKV